MVKVLKSQQNWLELQKSLLQGDCWKNDIVKLSAFKMNRIMTLIWLYSELAWLTLTRTVVMSSFSNLFLNY